MPPDGGTGINNVSVVLLGVVGGRRFLLTGDVEQDIDPSLLTEGLPHVDLLKVAHHGSRTATTDAFLAAVQPRIAVASAGTGNPYGHPAKRTLERLAASGARVYRTDVDGSVTVSFDASGPLVKTRPRREGTIDSRLATAGFPLSPVASRLAVATPGAGQRRSFLCGVPAATAFGVSNRGAASASERASGRTALHEMARLRRGLQERKRSDIGSGHDLAVWTEPRRRGLAATYCRRRPRSHRPIRPAIPSTSSSDDR